MATTEQTSGAIAPHPSLLGIPIELRLQIYKLVAVKAPRVLQVCRLMELETKKGPLPDLRNHLPVVERLNSIVALHPLSRTCRQLRQEFQPVLLNRPIPSFRFIINNFDLAQIEFAANFLHKHCVRICGEVEIERVRRYFAPYEVLHFPFVDMYFMLDSDIVNSAKAFLDYLITNGQLPPGLTTLSTIQRTTRQSKRINTFSPFSRLVYRRGTPGMSPRQAAGAITEQHIAETRKIFTWIEYFLYDFDARGRESVTWSEETVYWIRYVWGRYFRLREADWRERVIEHPRQERGRLMYLLNQAAAARRTR